MKAKTKGIFLGIIVGFVIGFVGALPVNGKSLYSLLQWINNNPTASVLLVTVLLTMASWWVYLSNQKKALSQRDFINYHQAISWLISGRNNQPKADDQVACVFELRNLTAYQEVSERILEGLKTDWSKLASSSGIERILQEIDITLEDFKKETPWWRIF